RDTRRARGRAALALSVRRRRDGEDVADVTEDPRVAGRVVELSGILDRGEPVPDLRGDGERTTDQVGVGDAVDIRFVGGVEREAETHGAIRESHPEDRRSSRDVLVDPRKWQRERERVR